MIYIEKVNQAYQEVLRQLEPYQKTALALSEIALQILVPLGTCLVLHYILPRTIASLLIPMAAFGTTTSAAFLRLK